VCVLGQLAPTARQKGIYRHQGLQSKITSGIAASFTSKFRSTMQNLPGNRLNMLTAFHPKTDGKSVCAFGVFQEMIRPFLVSFNGAETRISLS
jgi:hypothetical protein